MSDTALDLTRRSTALATELLGARITSRVGGQEVTVRLVEVEAYEGTDDPGSHAFRGPTPRNEVMFGPPGRLYVYRHLGLHHCANLVCGPDGVASAVLLRAGEVVAGTDEARRRRLAAGVCRTDRDLARGPARLAVALGLTREHNAAVVAQAPDAVGLLSLEPGPRPAAVASGGRVGVSGAGGDAARFGWRYWIEGDPHVSAYRAAGRR
ncbi:DNA-3-methyladenine glycosylase [Occultella glacieicola]|uniref:Putative 3-methyladenine DNA glycosylase n=1 Tax=Occultella glacieicola TaxID=2518684 RepID=A0ABY2E0H5_9MICO|nr:DNA-3-methyladenine glycosylase [Occultella glacieicola]TDE90904.1 DNA-3-methyladenine glycosylase [Occultella glacieicola]